VSSRARGLHASDVITGRGGDKRRATERFAQLTRLGRRLFAARFYCRAYAQPNGTGKKSSKRVRFVGSQIFQTQPAKFSVAGHSKAAFCEIQDAPFAFAGRYFRIPCPMVGRSSKAHPNVVDGIFASVVGAIA
jgi:hypothetical protein